MDTCDKIVIFHDSMDMCTHYENVQLAIEQDQLKMTQIAKTLKSTSIRYRSDGKVSDRCLIDVDPMVFAIWGWRFQNNLAMR